MKPLLFALNALCAADAVTTHTAIARGASEAWIPSQNVWLLDGVAAGTAVTESSLLVWLDRNRHPKAARIIGWTFVAVRAAAVTSNVVQLHKQR